MIMMSAIIINNY